MEVKGDSTKSNNYMWRESCRSFRDKSTLKAVVLAGQRGNRPGILPTNFSRQQDQPFPDTNTAAKFYHFSRELEPSAGEFRRSTFFFMGGLLKMKHKFSSYNISLTGNAYEFQTNLEFNVLRLAVSYSTRVILHFTAFTAWPR